MVIFDTSVLIKALRGEKDATSIIESYTDKEEAAITVVNKYELLKGRRFLDNKIADLLISSLKVYCFDEAEAEEAARIYKGLKNSGTMINELDIVIAGIAIANNETLVVDDKDFDKIKGLAFRKI